MTTYYRRDDFVQNGLGYAMQNVAVTYLVEPGLTLATIYADSAGATTIPNPQFTDSIGHAEAYMAAGQYTVTYTGTQIQTLTLPDQNIGTITSGNTVIAFAGVPAGTKDGANRVFTLTNGGVPLSSPPTQVEVWQNFPRVVNVGYTISGTTITYALAPLTTDTIWAQGVIIS